MYVHTAVACTAAAIGDTFGFIASRFIHTVGVTPIRRVVEECVSALAKKRFGEVFDKTICFQCSLVLAGPVASMVANLVWTCISGAVSATVMLSAEIIGLIHRKTGRVRSMILTGSRIFIATTGFFIRRTIIHYTVPVSIVSSEVITKTIFPLLAGHPLARYALTTVISLSGTACVPLSIAIASEIIAFIAQQTLHALAKAFCDKYIQS